ncbi:DUF1642 domain-containing protein [Lactiplantibacillus plantarum]|uniref:DUF1642 domain-containing protein n=2 Tax=Lactiplantibacillus plantarum TaxID=1590 RepID=UPI001BA53A20|nr:DUF1642 domain-containing protein [Lactiplantibacillus plantarum]MBS0951687.1 DUF1642 domain-containing protein [Lactiplantibacillus plantarum]
MIKVYRKTATIKAEQFTKENEFELIEKYSMELFEYVSIGSGPNIPVDHAGDGCMIYSIDTKRGQIHLVVGDWIATGVNGEHWAVADDVFKKTYAELPVVPHYVAEYINYMKSSYRDIWDAINYPFRSDRINKYLEDNSETFARAWLDGYVVEEKHD